MAVAVVETKEVELEVLVDIERGLQHYQLEITLLQSVVVEEMVVTVRMVVHLEVKVSPVQVD